MSQEAASILISTQQISGYNSSIHCSYYAVLQCMKYILNNTDNHPIDYEQQKSQGGDSSHEYIIKAIRDRIDNKYQARLLTDEIYRKQKRQDYQILYYLLIILALLLMIL